MSKFINGVIKLAQTLSFTPNDKQIQALKMIDEHQISAHRWSRRFGKSHIFSTLCNYHLLMPRAEVCILAPTLKLTDIIFNKTIDNLNTLNLKPQSLNYKEKILKTEWQSYLFAATFKNIRQVLGRSYDLFIIDEAALLDTDTLDFFYQDIAPTLLERNGKFACISTPRNKQQVFYKFCTDFPSTHATIYDQNHIPITEINKLEQQYIKLNKQEVWKQEFLAEFVDLSSSNVFNWTPTEFYVTNSNDLIINAKENTNTHTNKTNSFNSHTNNSHTNFNNILKLSDLEYFIGFDPGYIHPSALTVIGVHTETMRFFIMDAWKQSQASLRTIASKTQEFIDRYEPLEIYADPANRQVLEELAVEYDISFKPAKKPVETILNFMQSISNRVYINRHSTFFNEFTEEWLNYRTKNGKIVKTNDDIIDSMKYAIYNCYIDYYYGEINELLNLM